MKRTILFILIAILLVSSAVFAESLRKGEDASPNDMEGEVVYNRPFCWDTSGFWNM